MIPLTRWLTVVVFSMLFSFFTFIWIWFFFFFFPVAGDTAAARECSITKDCYQSQCNSGVCLYHETWSRIGTARALFAMLSDPNAVVFFIIILNIKCLIYRRVKLWDSHTKVNCLRYPAWHRADCVYLMRFLAGGSACALGFEGNIKVQSDPDSLFFVFFHWSDSEGWCTCYAMHSVYVELIKGGQKSP